MGFSKIWNSVEKGQFYTTEKVFYARKWKYLTTSIQFAEVIPCYTLKAQFQTVVMNPDIYSE